MNASFAIRPEITAAKLDAIRADTGDGLCVQSAKQPRLAELILWLQWKSIIPGGLHRIPQTIIDTALNIIGTPAMLAIAGQSEPWTLEQKLAVLAEIPPRFLPGEVLAERWRLPEGTLADDELSRLQRIGRLAREITDEDSQEHAPETDRSFLEALLKDFDSARCLEICRHAALRDLPEHMFRFCSEPQSPLRAPWYCPRLVEHLLDAIDADTSRAQARIPSTPISHQIEEALQYAIHARAVVKIETDGRFLEKQTAIDLCSANPAKMRLVETPSDAGELAFHRAVARAAGLETGFAQVTPEIRLKTAAIARSAGFLFVFLDAQYLLPTKVSHNTPASRIQWIETGLVRHRVPVAFIANRLDWSDAAERYRKKTKLRDFQHPIDAWMAQNAVTYSLPGKLSREDILALARASIPESELDSKFLPVICADAALNLMFLSDVKKIASLARFLAGKARRAVTLDDVQAAIARVKPAAPEQAGRTQARPAMPPTMTPEHSAENNRDRHYGPPQNPLRIDAGGIQRQTF